MSIVSIFSEFLVGGGLTSILTGGLTSLFKYKELKLLYAHDEKKWDYEVKLQDIQSKQDQWMAENNRLLATTALDAATMVTGIKSDSEEVVSLIKANKQPWWAILRVLFRPIITFGLLLANILLPFIPLQEVPDEFIFNENYKNMYIMFQQQLAAALGFWFGSRTFRDLK